MFFLFFPQRFLQFERLPVHQKAGGNSRRHAPRRVDRLDGKFTAPGAVFVEQESEKRVINGRFARGVRAVQAVFFRGEVKGDLPNALELRNFHMLQQNNFIFHLEFSFPKCYTSVIVKI